MIANVTLRRLVGMNAGLIDYNDQRDWVVSVEERPTWDITPWDYIGNVSGILPPVNGWFRAPPGTLVMYSSIGIMMSAMMVAAILDQTWEETSPLRVMNPDLVRMLPNTVFAGRGPCAKY